MRWHGSVSRSRFRGNDTATLHSETIANPAVEHDAPDADGPECMIADWFWRRDGHVDLRRLAADQPPRQLLSHRARKRDAAAVAAEIDQHARSGLMHMRIVIGGHGKPAVPAVGPANPLERRPQPDGIAHEIGDRGWILDPLHRPAAAHQQTVRRVDAIIDGDMAAFVQYRPRRHDCSRDFVGKWLGRGDRTEYRHDGTAQAWPEIIRKSVGGDQNLLGPHHGARRLDAPSSGFTPWRDCRRLAVDRSAGRER